MDVTVIKKNYMQKEVWRYSGLVLKQSPEYALIEARFNRPDLFFHGIWLNKGDRFVELYYMNRWFNIFEIHDHLNDELKGWYCNLSCPAQYENADERTISYVDLALDILIFPDGKKLLLDEDEFEALQPPTEIRQQVDTAILQLQNFFASPITISLENYPLD